MVKLNPEKRKTVLIYILVIACEILVVLAGAITIGDEVNLEFYSNAYHTAGCNRIQLYYSYGEEFSEDNSIVASSLTEQGNGYSIDLSGMDIESTQTIRMDFFLQEGQKVSVEGFALKAGDHEIKRVCIDDNIRDNCIFINDMEYLAGNEFVTTGNDPYIIFGADTATELREGYAVFQNRLMLICFFVLMAMIALQIIFRKKIAGLSYEKYSSLKYKIVHMSKNEIIAYIAAVIFNLAIIAAAIWVIQNEFALDLYSNADGASYSDRIQLYYSYGEEFSEKNSAITSPQTKFENGYTVKLSRAKVKDIQAIRLDYFLQEGQKVEIQKFELRFGKIILNSIILDEDVWNSCMFNDMEYLGKGSFEITGEDPYIIFDTGISKEIREPYTAFGSRIWLICFLAFGILIFLEIILGGRVKMFLVRIYRLADRKKILCAGLVMACDLLLMFLGEGLIKNGFSLTFYTDAYYAANGNKVQLYYSMGEDFDENHTIVTGVMTKLKDGFSIDLSGVDIKELQAVRMDYFLEKGRKIEANGFALKFHGLTLKEVAFSDGTWNNCFYNDIEHLGNGKFKITGKDPHIVFDRAIANEFQRAYRAFYNIIVGVFAFVMLLLIGLEILYRNRIMAFLEDKYKWIKDGVLNMHIELYFNDILKLYDWLYPIVAIIIGIIWKRKNYNLQTYVGEHGNIIKIIIFCSFIVWIGLRVKLDRNSEKQ